MNNWLSGIILGLLPLFTLFLPANVWAACIGASPNWRALDASYAEVNDCVSKASPEDTINVPAGSANWGSTLSINKGINLIGAGVGSTVISGGAGTLINYSPSGTNATHNYAFPVSGFTFNLGGIGKAIFLDANDSTRLQTKIRIDHNRFYNSNNAGVVENPGMRGVVDRNTFDTMSQPIRSWRNMGDGYFGWQHFPVLAYGTDRTMWWEDNTFLNIGGHMWAESDTGGRYSFGYNTITIKESHYPLLDVHGPNSGAGASSFGGEIYGNQINGGPLRLSLLQTTPV